MLFRSASLSAGEKQLMVISLLWALAICSKKKLPVIIDTPLSRLDSAHRVSPVSYTHLVEGRNFEIDALPLDELVLFDED